MSRGALSPVVPRCPPGLWSRTWLISCPTVVPRCPPGLWSRTWPIFWPRVLSPVVSLAFGPVCGRFFVAPLPTVAPLTRFLLWPRCALTPACLGSRAGISRPPGQKSMEKTIAANPRRSFFEKCFKYCFDGGFRIYAKIRADSHRNH